MAEPLPLASLQQAVLEILRGRNDVVAQELRAYLRQRFHIAVRVRRVRAGRGLRVFQMRKAGNRHLVDLRSVETLPTAERLAGILVMAPAELVASKVIAYHQRRGQPKAGTDWRDLALLLLKFPALKSDPGPVGERLHAAGAAPGVLAEWKALIARRYDPQWTMTTSNLCKGRVRCVAGD